MPRIVSLGPDVTEGLDPVGMLSRGLQLGQENQIRQEQLQLAKEREQRLKSQEQRHRRALASQARQDAQAAQGVGDFARFLGGDPELAERLTPNPGALRMYLETLAETREMEEVQQATGHASQLLNDMLEGAQRNGIELGEEEQELVQQTQEAIRSATSAAEAKQALQGVQKLRVGYAERLDEAQQYPKEIARSQQMIDGLEQLVGSNPEAQPVLGLARKALLLAGTLQGAPPEAVSRLVWKTIQTGELPYGLAVVAEGAEPPPAPVPGRAELEALGMVDRAAPAPGGNGAASQGQQPPQGQQTDPGALFLQAAQEGRSGEELVQLQEQLGLSDEEIEALLGGG